MITFSLWQYVTLALTLAAAVGLWTYGTYTLGRAHGMREASAGFRPGEPRCPVCGDGEYVEKTPGGTEWWSCGHAVGK